MTAPLVSVIVLNFNGEGIIARCLDHLLAQTYPNTEIIVVDNCSADRSRAILETYRAGGRVTVVYSPANRGCAGGRNLGLQAARGDLVAFMDNDGYASPVWLEHAVRVLHEDEQVGAVASLVFFNRHKIIVNGGGGTLNHRGYGGDFGFKEPYEFACLPRYVLYPMGCGMVVRRGVLDAMGAFDELLFNYYDDVEVGLWTWRLGRQVVLAADAWVDHDFGASEEINRNKVILCERNRIRTVLKYFPARHLPRWLAVEASSLFHARSGWRWAIPYRAWGWNLRHLRSALRQRRRFGSQPGDFRALLYPTWGEHPPPRPNNHLNRPVPADATPAIDFADGRERRQLNYGWYPTEQNGSRAARWAAAAASAFVRVPDGARAAEITWCGARGAQQTVVRLRPVGEIEPVWQAVQAVPLQWDTRRLACSAAAGIYELQMLTAPVHYDHAGRELGVRVARIAFV